jgi:hypothetical protein
VGSSPGDAGYQPAPPGSDLNLKEVQLLWPGWPDLSPHFLFETLAEVDFYSYRPRDLTLQASQAASLLRNYSPEPFASSTYAAGFFSNGTNL